MASRPRASFLLLGGALSCVAAVAALDRLLAPGADGPSARSQTHLVLGVAAALAFLVLVALVDSLNRLVLLPLEALGREIRILGVNPGRTIELPRSRVRVLLARPAATLATGHCASETD